MPSLPALMLPRLGSIGECACKLCGGVSPVFGSADFNRHCVVPGNPYLLPESHIPVSYNRCSACGFLFTTAFDGWSHDDFKTFIYNDDYGVIDPEYVSERPTANLTWLVALFGEARSQLRMLDYGGGNGMLAQIARADGFADYATYDPFTPEFAARPIGTFDLITSFETLEHVPDPLQTIGQLCALTREDGVIFFSTLIQPDDMAALGTNWWYVAPRNGHISLFSAASLHRAFIRFGLKVAYFDENKFIACRKVPEFAEHLFKNVALPEMISDV